MVEGIRAPDGDRVHARPVAPLDRLEANGGKEIPASVYPSDGRIDRRARALERRPGVEFSNDRASRERRDNFDRAARGHPIARARGWRVGSEGDRRFGTARRHSDGPFDRFEKDPIIGDGIPDLTSVKTANFPETNGLQASLFPRKSFLPPRTRRPRSPTKIFFGN